MNILIICYAISPVKGSEFAFGWDYVNEMAKHHKIHLLYGMSDNNMGETQSLKDFYKKNPNPNIVLYPVRKNFFASFFDWFNQKGLIWFWHIAFRFWHKEAYRVANAVLKNNHIDILHTLNPQGFREPGYLWKFDKPHIWGPIGGANIVNKELLSKTSFRNRLVFQIREYVNLFQLKYKQRIRKSAKKSAAVIFSTAANKMSFNRCLKVEGPVISEMGFVQKKYKFISNDIRDILDIVWAGNISERKNLRFLIYALSKTENLNKIRLNIVGDGPNSLIEGLKNLIRLYGMENNVVWHGRKSREETIKFFEKMHLHAITSLSEASTSVLYEALSVTLPTISLDQDGMRDALKHGSGFLVPISTYEKTADDFARQIDMLITEPTMLMTARYYIEDNYNQYTWEHKIENFLKIYAASVEK